MPLTRLDNLISSKTGKYLYVSPDDFNATDALSNRGNSPITPFKSIQRAFLEIARYSYLPGFGNDRFDQFSIMLMPGIHYIDNRPGLVDTTNIDAFDFDQATNAWTDNSILDISNPDNVLYKFNNTEGGAIIPRGSSLVGYDLRRTTIRPLYVPDPATTEREIPRSAIFNVTGGCYFWQFTIKDGQTTSESPLYDTAAGTGKVYYDPNDFTKLAAPNYSHHKLTVFEYADQEELGLFYRKIAKAFEKYQPTIVDPGEFDFRIQENRIVGPLSDSRVIESLTLTDNSDGNRPDIPASTSEITVTTKVDHGYFQGQFVAIANTEIDDVLEGIFPIVSIDQNDPRKFTYQVPFVVSAIGSGLSNGETVTQPTLGANAQTLAEVDSVESASPYVFNVSIRSTWGICGIWANGLKATGFKSMVIAQYTGVSLQKDDRAFIRYDEYSNTWNQASLVDAFATVPYHAKGDSYWKDEWRNFHVRASEDAFIQNVSIFAVGFADHFLMESGGDMSITNSNSNFGNTSLHAIGFKGFAFNQDKGGYITDIIPPKQVVDTETNTKKVAYYTIDIQGTLQESGNYTKLFLGSDDIVQPTDRPAATIDGFRIGAKSNEELYVKLDPAPGTDEFFEAQLEPTGFVKYLAKGDILNPTGGVINSVYADAANLIESNRRMIQEEVFGYILEKYPRLQNISYVNPGLDPAANRYFDARNLILSNRQQIVNEAYASMLTTFPNYDGNNGNTFEGKCKRDIGLIVDAVAEDLRDGGNANIIDATRRYFDGAGQPLNNGLVGEENPSIFAFNRAKDLCKKAVANLLNVQADLYDPDPNSNLGTYGIGVGYTGSAAEEAGLTTNGVTIDVAQNQDPAGRYKDARNRIVANREFILDAALAEISVYHPDFYIPGDQQTDDQSRLADAFRLIRRNSSEIRDKALAAIAVNHPNFYIPGDQQTDEGSRYASAYRLIQNNRDQIVDTGLAQIAIGHPDFWIPGDQQTDERSRYADGYRLIQQNKTEIVTTAYANMLALYPNYDGNNGNTFGDKCKRDIGFLIDAVSLDLFVGGNKYSRKFISEYFDSTGNNWISGGLQGEETASIEAFNQARDLMGSAVSNQLSITDNTVTEGPAQYGGGGGDISRTNANACDDVQSAIDTLVNIITTPIAAGNLSSLPAETSYIAGPGETKCRRDIGIFVDSLALDLFNKGNVYTWRFCAEYFSDANTQIVDGLLGEEAPSLTAFTKAAEMMKKAFTNQLYEKDLFRTADNAPGSAYGQVTRSFTPHGATYDPATGITVLSIANHDLSVGDYITIATDSLTFTCSMDSNATNHTYPRATDPVAGQYIEITAVTDDTISVNVGASGAGDQYVHTFVSAATNAVTFAGNTANQLTDAQPALCSDVQAATDTLLGIVTDVFTSPYGLQNMPTEVNYGYGRGPGESKCARDIGYFIDAVSVDMYCAGNKHTKEFTRQYFTDATTPLSNGLVGEEAESVTAFNTAISEMRKAVYNSLYYKDLTVTEGDSVYGNGDGPIDRQSSAACSDVQSAIQTLGDIATAAITAGNISGGIWNDADNPGVFKTGESKCRRDIGHVVDAIAQDLWFGGNEYTLAATKEYFDGNSLITNGVDNEVGPSITAFKRAADLMNRAANNQYYDRDLTITLDAVGDPPIVGDIECDAHRLVLLNKEFIAEEAYQRMLVAYPSYTPSTGNTKQDCLDDVYNVLEEVMWDVKFGGNSKTYDSAKIYVTNVFNGQVVETFIDAERDEAAKVFTEAKNIAIQVLNNETVTVSSGNNLSQTKDPTIVEDWDAGELLPRCGSAVAAVDTLLGMIIQAIGTDAGVGTLTATRTTGAPADPAYDTAVNITAVTSNTITFNVGTSTHIYPHTFVSALPGAIVSGGAYDHRFVSAAANSLNVVGGSDLTPTNATYDAATGAFTMYFGSAHGVTTSDQVSLDDGGFTFKCAMDNYTAAKAYPRAGVDPISGQNVNPTAVTATSITIDVGTSVLVEHNVTTASYDPASGDVVVTTSAPHNLSANTSIKVKTEGLTFTCTKDQNVTTHSYPRAARAYQPSGYQLGNCSDVLQTIDTLTSVLCDALYAGNLDGLPPLSNGLWDCANVRASIETLFDILTEAIDGATLAGLPPVNTGDFTINNEASKCFRDVSYIVDAVVNDLRLGGNINSIQAGEAYYVGNSLTYIDGEKTETLDAWNYVGQLATAAMRNFDVLAFNCTTTAGSAIVDVNDTRGIVIGMSVKEYDDSDPVNPAYVNGLLQSGATQVTTNIPEGAYVKRIVSNTQIELGAIGSRLDQGNLVNAAQSSTTTELYFVLEEGAWADTLPTTVTVGPEASGPDVIQDTLTSPTYRECSGTADAIETLVGNITTIINSGLGTVTRQEQTVDTTQLASRATVFTIDTTGTGPSNPHNFETGTPVRLVPRPRFDVATGKYVDVDKRLVRLPNGFETNRTYYVIAPGRFTQPEDYSGTTYFNGVDQTKLMLATSKENAAAGIYIYASETDSIDKDVEIDMYQFVLDDKYDLHNYTAITANGTQIQTDVSHIFDVPNAGTTPHKVFFRAVEGGLLPSVGAGDANDPDIAITDINNANVGRINPNKEFFAKYVTPKTFSVHKTHADAISGADPITFVVTANEFQIFANKRRSPMRFDPTFTNTVADTGKWFIQCKDNVTGQPDSVKKNDIFWRINESDYADRPRSTDMWYERLDDTREADERTYKIRFVIPKYLENARDPISGFVLKTRTDDTRKLVPQKILLKPVTGTVYGARFENPRQPGERIGFTTADFTANSLNSDIAYDPYLAVDNRAYARFNSGVQATIQSGRYVEDELDESIKYLELTVFDHTIDTVNFPGLGNEILTTVKITAPQGGSFVTSKTDIGASDLNAASFAGNSSGLCNIHGYFNVGGDHYLIIKNIRGGILEYSEFTNTRFTQGNVFADMLEDQDMGKSLPLKTLIKKKFPEYFYKQDGANVYTITPGDRIQDGAGVEYYVDKVEDVGVVEDSFYIFGYETLQRRIAGQQDGIYYITALRGNVSPFPTGAGVSNNFRKFKFSQPVSKLYPLNYRNDPLWFKNSGTTQAEKDYYANLIDPPQTFSAADNYIHGLVTVNDFKNSVTRELVEDLINNPAFIFNTYTGDNQIRAKDGNAVSGSEDRRIPIAGDSTVLSDQRYYIELRRPSIARAGNHTFEYLGFGPGNYSTGLPARQEVVLTPDEDFYAQSKKQDGGIVFYTGINSQGDLYIGNRRINAITGEETFIDRATLADDGDEDDVIGGLVTTFDTPVTFNQNITIVGGDGTLVNSIESPLVISVQDGDFTQVKDSLIIRSNVKSTENDLGVIEQDERLDRTQFNPPTAGDILLSKNRIKSAVFEITPIKYPRARGYKFLTHAIGDFGSNITPNQSPLVSAGGTRIQANQYIDYAGVIPQAGDVLIKGRDVQLTGSFAWIYADGYTSVSGTDILNITSDGSNIIKIDWSSGGVAILNSALGGVGITSTSQIRISDYYPNTDFNGTWFIVSPQGDPFSVNNSYVHVQLIDPVPGEIKPWADVLSGATPGQSPKIEFSNSAWKEIGIIGGEAIRTETTNIGDFKLGINTVARAPHDALENAWVSNETTPRANLDVVGTAFISGKTTDDFLDHTNFADRDKTSEDNALLVGGDSAAPNDEAVLRVATTNGGRVGINVDNSQLDRALVVDGTSRFTDDARFEHDIEVNGDDGAVAEVRTSQTTGRVNLFNDNTFLGGVDSNGLHIGGWTQTIKIGDEQASDQFIRIGNSSDHSNIFLGDVADTASYISKIQIGGAYGNNSSNSYTLIGTKQFSVAGDVLIGANKTIGGDITDPTQVVTLRTEAGVLNFFTTQTQTVNFATNASLITIGGQGGSTTVRNNFIVDANSRFNGDIKLCGGNASYSFEGLRAQLGTDDFAHASGELGNNSFNSNIDIINVSVLTVADQNSPTVAEIAAGFNRIDTAGAGVWGDTNFQESKTGAGAEGADLPAITGDEFYIPMKYAPTPYFQAGDYLLIDSAANGSGAAERYPELVRITEDGLQGATAAPYYLKVKRHPLGSFTKYKLQQLSPARDYLNTHLDATNVWKCNIAFDATWTTQLVDATGPVDNFYLSQFGGGLTTNDYVIVDREDTNNDGDFNQGEIVKVQTQLDQVSKKLIVTSGCDTANEKDVFVVDSVTGDITVGDETVQNSELNIYGSLTMAGGCGATPIVNDIFNELLDTSDNAKLTLTNRDFTTYEIDTCQGNTVIGNEWGWVWALQGYYGTTATAHTTSAEVFVYTRDPQTAQATGPQTLLGSVLSAGQTQFLVANSITGFEKGDLIAVIGGATQAEIIRITDDPYVDTGSSEPRIPFGITIDYPSGGRAQETTTAQSFTVGATVVKIQKDSRTTTLLEALPASGRTQAPSPNTNPDRVVLKLANGNLVSQKLDYEQFIRIGNEFFFPDSIDGNLDSSFGVKMPKSIRDSLTAGDPERDIRRYFGGGKLTVHDDINIKAGNLRMYGTDSKTLIFNVANDDGHPGDGAILDPVTGQGGMYLNGRADIFGQLRVFKQTCQENGVCTNDVQFRVQNDDGSVEMGASLYIKGQIVANADNTSEVLHIDNLGSAGNTGAGPKDFIMYQDGSVDAFGIRRYFNANGGRRWTYLAASTTGFGQVVGNPLQSNGNYLCNPSSSGNMVVYLPSDAQTGDMIRFIDISGNLSYAASLIIRALPIGTTAVPIQGDSTGTKASAGSAAPSAIAWNSGEMIVQTRNASFGLVYVGASDAVGDPDASEIPTDLRGWWIVEL